MKMYVRIGVRAKFLLLVGLLLGTIFLFMSVVLARREVQILRDNLYDEARAFATLATEPIGAVFVIYKDSGTVNIKASVTTYARLNKNISNVAIIDTTGAVLYSHANTGPRNYPIAMAQSAEAIYINDSNDSLQTIIFPYKESGGIRRYSLVYTVSNASIDRAIRGTFSSTLVFGLLWLIVTLVLLYFFVNYFLIRKIRTISDQSRAISSGNFNQVVSISSNDELGDLAHSVNVMAESLKDDIDKLRQLDQAKSEFMMITSHNLRTPLAIIDGYIDSAVYFKNVDQFKTALKEISQGSKRLGVFAEDVLTISQLEMGETLQTPINIHIVSFLEELATDFRELAILRGIAFTAHISPTDKTISISKPYMRAAIWNILDNALKFTEVGGSVTLSLITDTQNAVISVQDTGIGINPSEIGNLFTKFHRATDTMIYNYEGTGIGLYATKMIVQRHNGTVDVESTEGVGSTFTVTLPLTATQLPVQVSKN